MKDSNGSRLAVLSAGCRASRWIGCTLLALTLLMPSPSLLSARAISIDDFNSIGMKNWTAGRGAASRIVPRDWNGRDMCLSVSGKVKWLTAELRFEHPVSLSEPVYIVAEVRSVGRAGEVQLMVGNTTGYSSFRKGPSAYDAGKDWIRAIWKVNGFFSGDGSTYFDRVRFCQRVTGDGEYGPSGIAFHELLLDNVYMYTGKESETIQRECELRAAQTSYEGTLNFRLSENRGLTIWHSPSANKVFAQQCPPTGTRQEISISLARNESESFQLCLRSAHDRQELSLRVSNLNPTPDGNAPNLTSYWHPVRMVPIGSRYFGIPIDQWWPEPLSWDRTFSLHGGETQSVWVTVSAPADCKGGTHSGTIELLESSRILSRVALTVNVWDFTLPLRPTFRTNEQLWILPTGHESGGSQTSVLWEALETLAGYKQFDAQSFHNLPPAMKEKAVKKWGQNNFKLPYCGGHRGGWQRRPTRLAGMDIFTPAYEWALAEKIKEMTAYYRMHDLMQYCFIYLWDEPFADPEVYRMIKWLGTIVKSTCPGLKRLAAAPYNSELREQVDIFLSGYTSQETTRIGLEEGAEFWWTGVLAFYVDLSGIDQRMRFGFESIQKRLTGAYSWAIAHYKTENLETGKMEDINPWDEPDMWNKNATVLYPGSHPKSRPEKLCPSVSLELTRDGIEDYEYVTMLRKCLDRLRQEGNDADAKEVQGLISKSEDLYVASRETRRDFKILDNLYSLRSEIGKVLERHNKLLGSP